jgi:decaprenylphospho-beta-D-erythro-pentofuranosid-2-ulose 2-reductase
MKFLVLGANSAIAFEVMKLWARKGDLVLVARNAEKLKAQISQLGATGSVACYSADLTDETACEKLWQEIEEKEGRIDVALSAFGLFAGEKEAQSDFAAFVAQQKVNFLSHVFWAYKLVAHFKAQGAGRGHLMVISSVAGERGRFKNFVYASSKAAISNFLEGYSLRVQQRFPDIHISTIKPGFIATPMTAGMKKTLLVSEAASIAPSIDRLLVTKKAVLFVPGYWRWLSFLMRHIPRPLYRLTRF